MIYLGDVNFWLALTFESHVHHASAKQWFEPLAPPDGCAFCRLTQQGYLRLATNPKAFGDEAVTLSDAWKLYDALLSDPRVSFVEEPLGVEIPWRQITSQQRFTPEVWSDAYLAAFAQRAGCEIVTFDQGFGQFQRVMSTILS
jgi:uncharacterized protein